METKELYKELDKASEKYLKLRDAKSNGCLTGKSLQEILEYDAKIEKAAKELKEINDRLSKY